MKMIEENKVYGYCRISTYKQKLERQIENILREVPTAIIHKEIFTGTLIEERKVFKSLMKKVKAGDTIIFDSVSRMSRSSVDGVELYFELMNRDINLVFLKERYIDTDVYKEQLKANNSIKTDDKDLNETIMLGLREYLKRIATRQIKIAFDQSEKEVNDMKQRTKEALKILSDNGAVLGRKIGSKIITQKSLKVKEIIKKNSKYFGGTLNDTEILKLAEITRNTFYKYKKEIMLEGSVEPVQIAEKVLKFLEKQNTDYFKTKNNKVLTEFQLFTKINELFNRDLERENIKAILKARLEKVK
ncbi:MAG: recombinase family protein [Fusobacteriaceae bacterium]